MSPDFDVIVIGGGGAGMAAAIEASDAGARVLLVESERTLGGSTALSGGHYLAAGTSVQRAHGIEGDTWQSLYTYYMTLNQWRVDPAVVRTLCEHAAPALEWLTGFGVEFPELATTGVDPVPRGHLAEGGGASIAKALERACRARNVEVALDNRVERILTEDGRVAGVHAGGDDAMSHAVIVATGGFGQNLELLKLHYPDAWVEGRTWSVAAPGSRGDALRFAEQVGASIAGHNRGLIELTPGLDYPVRLELYEWFVYLTPEGRRFIDESLYLSLPGRAAALEQRRCFCVFDEAARLDIGPLGGFKEVFTGAPIPADDPALDRYEREGRIFRAGSFEELARKTGMHPALVTQTLERYNADCAADFDSLFGKDPATMKPVATPPFYAVEMVPALVALTGTGLRIDPHARVLDHLDRPIPGLYAAGEATGSTFGELYVGSGNSIANSIVFGRIAGVEAAREAQAGGDNA